MKLIKLTALMLFVVISNSLASAARLDTDVCVLFLGKIIGKMANDQRLTKEDYSNVAFIERSMQQIRSSGFKKVKNKN